MKTLNTPKSGAFVVAVQQLVAMIPRRLGVTYKYAKGMAVTLTNNGCK